MNYLLDTCVVSELVKLSPDENVVAWIKRIPSERLFLCSLTIGEIQKGLSLLPDSRKKEALIEWLSTLHDHYKDRILGIDSTVAECWGHMQALSEKNGRPMASIDGLIAATAGTHRLTLVTRNVKDFEESGVPVINPWENL